MAAHSTLGASSAKRWVSCPASVKLIEAMNLPPKSNFYADQGSIAHELCEECLLENKDAISFLGDTRSYGETTITVDEEMVEGVQLYVDTVLEYRKQYPTSQLNVEQRFDLSWLHVGMFGTNDASIANHFERLVVFDFKYGAGEIVEVEDNLQLIYYALGAAYNYNFNFEEVEVVIVQPRARHADGVVRRWLTTMENVLSYREVFKKAAVESESANPSMKAGDHCKWCDYAPQCEELRKDSFEKVKAKFSVVTQEVELPKPVDLTPDEISYLLDATEQLEMWIKHFKGYAFNRATLGVEIPNYKLCEKRTHRKFEDEQKVIDAYVDEFESKLYTEPKLISPAQLEKLVGKKRKDEVAKFTYKPKGELTLTKSSDPRKVAVDNPLKLIFNKTED